MDITGIVIRSVDYGEKNKLVSIATADGILTAVAKGVRSANSKLKGFVGPLNFGEFGVTEGKAGFILSGASITESFLNCWSDPQRYAAAMLCLEIYEKCEKNGGDTNLADLLRALGDINYGEFYPPASALRYGVKIAVDMGVDITENVFPEKISGIFIALTGNAETEEILRDLGVNSVKECIMHLAAGYKTELGIVLTVAHEIFRL